MRRDGNPGNRGPWRQRWKEYGAKQFELAMIDNLNQIRRLMSETAGGARVLDLGCGDGKNYLSYAPPGAALQAVEGSAEYAEMARANGIDVLVGELDQKLPFDDGTFDVVVSNQVLEHLPDTDMFVAECFRVASPDGLVVISTENLASWHNIGALLLGWQAFSLTNVSNQRPGLGNPLANLRFEDPYDGKMQHRRIFSYRGLMELMTAHRFEKVRLDGAGYYPLPLKVAHMDPRHAAFLTVSGRKPRA
jgi:SAM-dependent methyltransferase